MTRHNLQQRNLQPIADKWEWQFDGLCRSTDPELFFLEASMRSVTKRKREEQAKKICVSCPVISQCRSHALTIPEVYGVWGGLSADEREQILKQGENKLHVS